jgi:hypothetical protein
VVAQVDSANRRLTYSLENRANAVDVFLHELQSDVLRIWIPLIVSASLLIGLFAGMGIQGCRESALAKAAIPTPLTVQPVPSPEPEDGGRAVGSPKQHHHSEGNAKPPTENEQ